MQHAEEREEKQQHGARRHDVVHGEDGLAEEKARLRIGPREGERLVAPFEPGRAAQHIAGGERHHRQRQMRPRHDGLHQQAMEAEAEEEEKARREQQRRQEGQGEPGGEDEDRISARHDEVAMPEIDDGGRPVDHRHRQGDEGVEHAGRDAADNELRQHDQHDGASPGQGRSRMAPPPHSRPGRMRLNGAVNSVTLLLPARCGIQRRSVSRMLIGM